MESKEGQKIFEQNLEKLKDIAEKYDALPICAGLKERLSKARKEYTDDPDIIYDSLIVDLVNDSNYNNIKLAVEHAPCSCVSCPECPLEHLCTLVLALKECRFVIAAYFDKLGQRPLFWHSDENCCGWSNLNAGSWTGSYEDAIKIAEDIEGANIMTISHAKEILSHYEEI